MGKGEKQEVLLLHNKTKASCLSSGDAWWDLWRMQGCTTSALLYLMLFGPSFRASAASPVPPSVPQDSICAGCVAGLQQSSLQESRIIHACTSS